MQSQTHTFIVNGSAQPCLQVGSGEPLLLIHGMADDNVVFENSSALIGRMQGEAVPFEMMLYPGYTHRVSGPKVERHLWETIFAFLERSMPPRPAK